MAEGGQRDAAEPWNGTPARLDWARRFVPASWRRPVAPLIVLAIVAAVAVAAIGRGQADDEGEHLHAAYLMGRWHQRPHVDFFQHHPNLLWTVLSPIFRFGPVSPTVAIAAGRSLVVLLLAATWLGLARIASGSMRPAALVNGGALLLAFTVAIFPEAISLRPETLGLPLIVWGWAIARGRRPTAAVCGGLLAGIACEAAPRFLSILPIFAIPPLLEQSRPDWKHIARVAAGWCAGFLGAAVASGETASDVLFNIRFSALLQKIGEGRSEQLPAIAGVLLCVFLMYRHALPADFRAARAYAAWEGAAWLAVLAGAFSAWPFLYGQALVPFVAAAVIMMARADEEARGTALSAAGAVVLNGAAIAAMLAAALGLATGSTVFGTLESRELVAATMRPGDTLLMRSRIHPIVARDASFYPVVLLDAPRRLTRVVQAARAWWPLPAVDYAADIRRNRPLLLDRLFVVEANPDADPDFVGWLAANYRQVSPFLFVLKDPGTRDQRGGPSASEHR